MARNREAYHEYFVEEEMEAGIYRKKFELTEEMCRAYEEYISSHRPLLGSENYAIFATHDELLGDEASTRAQELLRKCGFKVLIDTNAVSECLEPLYRLAKKHDVAYAVSQFVYKNKISERRK